MPILIKDYEWDQTEENVSLRFALPSSPRDLDVFLTSSYLKVSFSPYLFEAFFFHCVDPAKSMYEVSPGQIHFNLAKQVLESWDKFSLDLCKEVARDARNLASKEHEDNVQKAVSLKKEEKRKSQDSSIARQISINEERLKQQKEKLKREKNNFFKDSSDSGNKVRCRTSSSCSDGALSEGGYEGDVEETSCFKAKEEAESKSQCEIQARKCKKKPLKQDLPAIRQTKVVKIRMTPRNFPTPSRQSTAEQEEKILSKVSTLSNNDEDSAVKCSFYNDKALELFKSGDIQGCINAISESIKLCPCKASLYSNRAAGYLALQSYQEALDDCTKALELLHPPSKENEKSRLLCYIRKGTALVHLNKFAEGLKEYYAALKIDPHNALLRRDIATIESYNGLSSESADCEEASDESCYSFSDTEESSSDNSQPIEQKVSVSTDQEESESASR